MQQSSLLGGYAFTYTVYSYMLTADIRVRSCGVRNEIRKIRCLEVDIGGVSSGI